MNWLMNLKENNKGSTLTAVFIIRENEGAFVPRAKD
jgi:hypothetical protein